MRTIAAIFAVVLFVAGGVIWYRYEQRAVQAVDVSVADIERAVSGSTAKTENPAAPELLRPAAPERVVPAGLKEYRNDYYAFSLLVPEKVSVEESPGDLSTMTIVFADASGRSFQVYVQPYGRDHVTDERFKLDMPSAVMNEAQDIVIDDVPARAFIGSVAGIGETREVWFINNGFLYEVNTSREHDAWLSAIMNSWKFYTWPQTP